MAIASMCSIIDVPTVIRRQSVAAHPGKGIAIEERDFVDRLLSYSLGAVLVVRYAHHPTGKVSQ